MTTTSPLANCSVTPSRRHHFHLVPWKQQGYQLIQIAMAMAIDLGLNRPLQQPKEQELTFGLAHHSSSSGDCHSAEARRAYMGCYYLSVLYSHGLLFLHVFDVKEWLISGLRTSRQHFKPSNMQHNDYIVQCGESLQDCPEHSSDAMLLYLVQICKLDEDVVELYKMEKTELHTEAGQLRLQLHVKSFKQRLEAWRSSVPSSMQQSCKSLVIATASRSRS